MNPRPKAAPIIPVVTSYSNSALGLSIELTDGTTQVNSESIRLTLDGAAITPAIRKTGAVTTIQYEGSFDVLSNGLVSGDNVLAVEVHQVSASSSDVTLAAQLLTHDWILPPPPPKFTDVAWTGAVLKLEWIGPAMLQSTDAVTGPWNDLARAANPFIALPRGPAQFYRLKP